MVPACTLDAMGRTLIATRGSSQLPAKVQPQPPNLRDRQSLRYKKDVEIFRFLKDRLHGPVSDRELRELIAFLQSIRN